VAVAVGRGEDRRDRTVVQNCWAGPRPLARESCPVCASHAAVLGTKRSPFSGLEFQFRHCLTCGHTFIANPRLDFERLYDAAYYAGRGADANVEYLAEMEDPRTLREYEWRGVLRAVTSLLGRLPKRWLDYGCGLGGLVRYARQHGVCDAFGFDEGWAAEWMASQGLPLLRRAELATYEGAFDVITAVEVLEHVPDPVGLMVHVSSLLRPGGAFFLTTGNSEPHLKRFLSWKYVNCDVHIGYFQPRTLARVYDRAGLRPEFPGFLPGHSDIIRYKVLKALRFHRRNLFERALPWSVMARVVDRRHAVTAHPVAWKP
jgi:SAM-dependent methyltransferase